jgi:hypothetical protein
MNFTLFQSHHYNHQYLDDQMHLILFKKNSINNQEELYLILTSLDFLSPKVNLDFHEPNKN